MGQIGSAEAIDTLRAGLEADYLSIRAHCARALGTLGDVESAPMLLERLQREVNVGVNIAYVSALGNLGYETAVPTLLKLWDDAETQGQRFETALAVARIVGNEHRFVQLLRGVRGDLGTTVAQALIPLRKPLVAIDTELADLLSLCVADFAANADDAGALKLSQLIRVLLAETVAPLQSQVLAKCAAMLEATPSEQLEGLVLAVDVLLAVVGD